MVETSLLVRKLKVMVAHKWLIISVLPFILLIESSSAFRDGEKLYGDVSEDEVAIDHLEDLLRARAIEKAVGKNLPPQRDGFPTGDSTPKKVDHLSDIYTRMKIGKDIEFGVPSSDPRYYLPDSVLLNGAEGLPNPANLPPEHPMVKSQQDMGMKANERDPYRPNYLKNIYDTYGHQFSPEHGGPKTDEVEGLYRGHKYGPLPPAAREPEVSQPESVNYLQTSPHQANLPHYYLHDANNKAALSDFYFVALVSGCTAAAVCAVVGAGICYFRLHKSKRDAADAEYPAYGVTGPAKDFSPAAADRKLAQSAHMFHYQHQKQQMIALEKSSGDDRHCSTSDVDSEEECEEGDYTVYECPGLAPTGEMEVKNPLFSDDPTPASPARSKGTNDVKNDVRKHDNDEDEEEELN